MGEPDTVTCAYPVWVGFGPVHLANELGYFAEEGITVEEILDDDMPNAVAAMERGDIDCYLRTVGEYQGLGRRKDTQGIIIGTIDVSTGGDGWAADRAIQSVCDLKGQTIAVEPNLPARLLLQEALRRECNLSIRDTNLSDIAAADAVGVFASPDVAAVGTYEPVLSQVVATHQDRGAHIVVSSKDYADLILDIIMAHTDELAANPDKYVKFLRGIYRAIDYFYAHQEEAIPIIASHFSITPRTSRPRCPTSATRPTRRRGRSWVPRTSRAACSRCFARPWRSIWNSAPPTSSCSRRTTSPPTSSRRCRRTGSKGRAAA